MRYRIFVWSSQLILWPLLRPLHFIINDCNKCVTYSLGKLWSLHSNDHKFMTHQLPHYLNCRLLDEIRTNLSNASYSMYCAFMTTWCLGSWVPCVQSRCVYRADVSQFPTHVLATYFAFFPPISFLFSLFSFPLEFISPSSFLSPSYVP